MKYLCLGYHNEKLWQAMPDSERNSLMDETFAYADHLKANGHIIDDHALQNATAAATLRFEKGRGKVSVTDGPFAETREQLGGFYIIEAKDLNEAISIAARVPPARKGTVEVRPVIDLPGIPTA